MGHSKIKFNYVPFDLSYCEFTYQAANDTGNAQRQQYGTHGAVYLEGALYAQKRRWGDRNQAVEEKSKV